jgi:hypothetical protein
MNAQLTRPPVAELVFQLHSRPLHPEFFSILAARKVRLEDCDITAQITPAGHVISWNHPSAHLTEVATIGELPGGHRRLLSHRMRGERTDSVSCGPRLVYQMSFQVETLNHETYEHVHDEIIADGTRRGLLYNFRPHNRLALAPLGFVAIEARRGCLFFTAFHTFPDELTVVKTQSLIERS